MARKEIDVTITADGRDKGKVFHIRELSAMHAEKWAMRALQAAVRAGVNIPDNIADQGMATIAAIGIQTLATMSFAEAEPLLDEMFECVLIKPDRAHPEIVRNLLEDDIEEVATRIKLRRDILDLHVSFSKPASPSTSTSQSSGMAAPSPSLNTPMSPRRSVRPSPRTRVPL
jgi:hypothetical protein